ncbi:hypothetical protein HY484_03895 [Candidatus Woesearchaeota archaeon]|nr:hypothetical protein [Candidatus Woesearchaeota archaeon]
MAFQFAPLNTTLLLTSVVGFLFSLIYLPKISQTWALTLSVLFIIMFIAVMISMTKTPQ